MYSIDVAEVKKSIEDENLKKDIAVQKAVDLVKKESVVAKAKAKKEAKAEEGEEKPAAKKTTAKKTTTTKKTAAKKAEDKAELFIRILLKKWQTTEKEIRLWHWFQPL